MSTILLLPFFFPIQKELEQMIAVSVFLPIATLHCTVPRIDAALHVSSIGANNCLVGFKDDWRYADIAVQ
jgi:hypothetical protein